MILIPAIDLKDGKCVRLRKGIMDDSTVFGERPLDMAKQWESQGAQRLHLVDLNGAFAGEPVNAEAILSITKECKIPVQIGGGIRTLETAKAYLDVGVEYLIVGTSVIDDKDFVIELCKTYPGKIILGLDANDGLIATKGWAEQTDKHVIDVAHEFEHLAVNSIIYTDIARDGMMQGINIKATQTLADATTIAVIASGGVTNMDDITMLKATHHRNIMGAITGRAIYEGTLNFQEANSYLLEL